MSQTDDTQTGDESEFATKAREAMEDRERLNRENALLRAGLDPDSDEGKTVLKLVGEDITPESVRSTVDTLRSTFGTQQDDSTPPPVEVADPPPPDDTERRGAFQQSGAVSQGIGDRMEEPPPPDPVKAGYDNFDEARRRGTPVEDAAHHVLGALVQDAVEKGPKSVHVFEGWEAQERKEAGTR
jgi:hypothetical protein